MHSQSRFPLVLFFSVLAFLLAAAFISCKTEEETRTVEITSSSTSNTTGPVTCTVKEADYILHYQQIILTDDYGAKYVTKESEGFELAEYEDRSKTKVPNNSDEPIEPVKAGTEFKDLAKDYEGFSYSYAIQVDSTVYIYYTRNTVKYTFYDNSSEVFKIATTLSGVYGTPCEFPTIKIGGKIVTQWNESADGTGSPFTKEFKSKDKTFYPVQPIKAPIGTKIKPTALGDIVFCDGSAASMVEVKTATGDTLEKYKENAIAVIVFDKYDTLTGSASDGDTLIGVGIQALNSAAPESGERYKSLFKKIWRFNKRPNPYRVSYICQSYHGYYDLYDIQNLFGSFEKTANTNNSDSNDSAGNDWTAIKNAMDYGNTLKDPDKGNMKLTDELTEGWYLPNWHELGLLMASNYKYNTTLYSACDALEIARPDPASDNFWVTSSKVRTEDNNVYAAFINPANSYTSFTALVTDDTTYWKDCDDKCQVLPFREFK